MHEKRLSYEEMLALPRQERVKYMASLPLEEQAQMYAEEGVKNLKEVGTKVIGN